MTLAKNRKIVISKSNAIRLTKMLVVAHLFIWFSIASIHFIDKLYCSECTASLLDSMSYAAKWINPLAFILGLIAVLLFPFGTVTMGVGIYLLYLVWKKWEKPVVYAYFSVSMLIACLWVIAFDAMGRG